MQPEAVVEQQSPKMDNGRGRTALCMRVRCPTALLCDADPLRHKFLLRISEHRFERLFEFQSLAPKATELGSRKSATWDMPDTQLCTQSRNQMATKTWCVLHAVLANLDSAEHHALLQQILARRERRKH